MEKIVRENINEADNAEHNLKNYDAYKEAVAMFPVIKEILEDIAGEINKTTVKREPGQYNVKNNKVGQRRRRHFMSELTLAH